MRIPLELPAFSVLQESPNESAGESQQTTSNYRNHLGDFSNANWGVIVMGGFALFLLLMIRRGFKRR